MAYAEVTDVLARAGALKPAFSDGQPVSSPEIGTFLAQTAAEVDAYIGAQGFGVPVTDTTAVAALASVNADMALLLAIDANWPGSNARDDVADLRGAIQARVDAYTKGLTDGDLAVLLLLGAQAAAGRQGGSSDFWSHESLQYEWWRAFVDTRFSLSPDPWGVALQDGPTFTKNMAL